MFNPKPTISRWGYPAWGQSVWGWSDVTKPWHIIGTLFFTSSTEDSAEWRDGRLDGVLYTEGGQ